MKTGLSATAEPSSLLENFDFRTSSRSDYCRAKLNASEGPEPIYIVTFPARQRPSLMASPCCAICYCGGAMKLLLYDARVQWASAVFLALVAGYLDGYGLLFLGTYVSFMSGNTTF